MLLPKLNLQVNGAENPFNTFSITTSPLNQRIEAYWSKLRQDRPGWWKSFFQDMVDLELYNPSDPAQVDCLRYCFMNILRKELYAVAVEWNHHIISKSINGGPNGRPDTMFFLPHLYNSDNFLENVDLQEVEAIYPHVTDTPRDFSDEFQEFADFALQGNDHDDMPSDVASGLDLFLYLKERITDFS